MDEVIWVEVLSRRRDVVARQRCVGREVRLGRGYDNDVIIDDPAVSARHVRVFRDETGRLIAEDCGSVNGTFIDRERSRRDRIAVDGDVPIRIGHTFIRIRTGNHAVAPERAGSHGRRALRFVLAGLCVVALGIEVGSAWLADVGEPRFSYYLARLLQTGGVVAAWVGFWMLLSRTLSGQANFERNLLVGLTAVIAYAVYSEFARFSVFSLNWSIFSDYAYVAMWCILAATLFFSWRVASPTRPGLKVAAVVLLAALGVTSQSLLRSEARSDFGAPSSPLRLLPPAFRLAPARDARAFFSDIELLKMRLDRDQRLPP